MRNLAPQRKRHLPILLGLALLGLAQASCAPAPGGVSFLWSFDGESSCPAARVDTVDVEIFDAHDDSRVYQGIGIACLGGGLTIDGRFAPGEYTVYIDAYNARGLLLYEGSESVTVQSNVITDMGTIDLRRAGEPDSGGVAFNWSFEGESSCNAAGVDEVDIQLFDGDTLAYEFLKQDCQGGGIVLLDLNPGNYTLYADAYASDGVTLLYSASVNVTIVAGQTLELGDLDFAAAGPAEGSLVFLWEFLYPLDAPETDCAVAGVLEVDVYLYPAGSNDEVFAQTVPCNAQTGGLLIDPVEPGDYDLVLSAYGSYLGDDVFLYRSETLDISVTAGHQTDVGDVTMSRVEDSFADILVGWNLPQGTCAELGLTNLTFTLTRLQGAVDVVDDTFTVPCNNVNELRLGFVPGSYEVSASGTGTAGSYVGLATADIPPGQETSVSVDIVLDAG